MYFAPGIIIFEGNKPLHMGLFLLGRQLQIAKSVNIFVTLWGVAAMTYIGPTTSYILILESYQLLHVGCFLPMSHRSIRHQLQMVLCQPEFIEIV